MQYFNSAHPDWRLVVDLCEEDLFPLPSRSHLLLFYLMTSTPDSHWQGVCVIPIKKYDPGHLVTRKNTTSQKRG